MPGWREATLAFNTQRKEITCMYDPIIANEALPANTFSFGGSNE
jgi:hypothetical protein